MMDLLKSFLAETIMSLNRRPNDIALLMLHGLLQLTMDRSSPLLPLTTLAHLTLQLLSKPTRVPTAIARQ
jgi:hypothetical protein